MRISVLIVTIVLLETIAMAQPSPEDLYAEGQAAYDRGDYLIAVAKWQAAYDRSGEHGLLFNLAQAQRRAGNCTSAITTYRRFLTGDPDPTSEQHQLAEDLARELEGTCPQESGSAIPPPQVIKGPPSAGGLTPVPGLTAGRSDQAQPGRAWRVTGLVTSSLGLATLAIGLGLGHHGSGIGDEIAAACRVSCDWSELRDQDASGRRAVAIGKALDGVGIAAVVGGAVLYYLGVRRDAITVAPASGTNGGVVAWRGSW